MFNWDKYPPPPWKLHNSYTQYNENTFYCYRLQNFEIYQLLGALSFTSKKKKKELPFNLKNIKLLVLSKITKQFSVQASKKMI